jgi:hypothetical protein
LFAVTTGRTFGGTAAPNNAYSMVMLAFPSSPNEVQGTNATSTYVSDYATITSGPPGLRIQYIQNVDAASLAWDPVTNYWVAPDGATPAPTAISFAPELNVAGKYIFGASTGGLEADPGGKGPHHLLHPAGVQQHPHGRGSHHDRRSDRRRVVPDGHRALSRRSKRRMGAP